MFTRVGTVTVLRSYLLVPDLTLGTEILKKSLIVYTSIFHMLEFPESKEESL